MLGFPGARYSRKNGLLEAGLDGPLDSTACRDWVRAVASSPSCSWGEAGKRGKRRKKKETGASRWRAMVGVALWKLALWMLALGGLFLLASIVLTLGSVYATLHAEAGGRSRQRSTCLAPIWPAPSMGCDWWLASVTAAMGSTTGVLGPGQPREKKWSSKWGTIEGTCPVACSSEHWCSLHR